MTQRSVSEEIFANNPWYTDDQFLNQWRHPASRAVILNRWQVWHELIRQWIMRPQLRNDRVQVLDAGCGDGINLWGLQQILSEEGFHYQLWGLDYNPLRVKRARELIAPVRILLTDLRALPLREGKFHIILCNHVIEHVRDDLAVMAELKRILHPQGLLIIGVPNEGCWIARFRNRTAQPRIAQTTDHVWFYTWPAFEERLHKVGLVALDLRREGFFLPHQILNRIVGRFALGRWALALLRRVFRNQCAGLIIGCRRGN
jgi:2-polyprenyl-3-methyl-5-hydroxy-6-metoxy-1,4-benzoquinol methylase